MAATDPGAQRVQFGAKVPEMITPADSQALLDTLLAGGPSMRYNGTTLDLERGNVDVVALVAAARTATVATADLTNHNARGAIFFMNVTAAPGVDTVQLLVEVKDPSSGAYRAVLSTTATAATGTHAFLLYPGASSGGGLSTGTPAALSRTFRVRVVHSGSGSFTYGVGIAYIN